MSHNQFPKLVKLFSLQRFRKKVSNHVGRGAMHNREVALFDLICQEEITDVDGTGSFAGTSLTIVFKQNRGLVVLKQNVLLDLVVLGLHE